MQAEEGTRYRKPDLTSDEMLFKQVRKLFLFHVCTHSFRRYTYNLG